MPLHTHGHAQEAAFHIPDSIPTGKFKEPHHEKKHEGDDENVQGKSHEAGMEEVTDMKKEGNKQNEGMKSDEAGLEGQPHGSA